MKCKAESDKFNCGCCDDTTLDCDLEEGHEGSHRQHRTGNCLNNGNPAIWRAYEILWRELEPVTSPIPEGWS